MKEIFFKFHAASSKDASSKAEKPSAPKQQQPLTSSHGVEKDSTLTTGDAIEQHLQTNHIGNKIKEHV